MADLFCFFIAIIAIRSANDSLLITHLVIIQQQLNWGQHLETAKSTVFIDLVIINMKIYSQINPADPPPSHQNQNNRNSQFSFHRNSQDLPRSQISDNSSLNQKNKFSFKLQPQLYFQRNNPHKGKLYQTASHIRVASSSSSQSLKELAQQLRVPQSRKKIFDESMRITVLNEKGEKIQSKMKQKADQSAQPIRKAEQGNNKALVSILKKSIEAEQSSMLPNNNSSLQRSRESNRKSIHRVQFVHEDTDKYLTKPILQQLPPPQVVTKRQPSVNLVNNTRSDLSEIMERIEKNQRHLIELNQKLDKKIFDDDRKGEYFMRLLAQNNNKSHQKDLQIQKYQQQIGRLKDQRVAQKQRIELQIQQSKRLQQLILQNRHLCAKVLQQTSQKTQNGPSPQENQIEQRIRELQTMRQNMQNRSFSQSQSLHLNESIVPPPHPIQISYSNPIVRPARTIHPVRRVSPPSILHQNPSKIQMIPQRDPPLQANPMQIKRVVLVSKIY